MQIILLSALIVAIQISDTYLRYLSFHDGMSDAEHSILWRRFFGAGKRINLDGAERFERLLFYN